MIPKEDFNEWLEDAIAGIYEMKPRSMAFCAINENGDVATTYYNSSAQDIAIFVHNLNSDILFHLIRYNKDYINELLEGKDEDECND